MTTTPTSDSAPTTRSMALRLPVDLYDFVQRRATEQDVDVTRMVKRMIRYCQENMDPNWLPPVT